MQYDFNGTNSVVLQSLRVYYIYFLLSLLVMSYNGSRVHIYVRYVAVLVGLIANFVLYGPNGVCDVTRAPNNSTIGREALQTRFDIRVAFNVQ